MKKFFVFLLLANISAALYLYVGPGDKPTAQPSLLHPEKIVLLPDKVDCLKWGQLFDPVLQPARTAIAELQFGQSHLTEVPEGKAAVYWVHIPALKTAQEIAQQIDALKKLRVPHLLIQENGEGPWHNTIALATLRDESAADALVDQLQDQGLVHVKQSAHMFQQFVFVIREPSAQLARQLQPIVQRFPDTGLEITECDRI
ncbi:hypothetical protein [Nitrosomonas sp. ANs5]|uniref:hypothetical protein n=1 Tax=Nitrosomonas sp. ANs5 TaxID=3423941 RepID=UPI003D32C8A8